MDYTNASDKRRYLRYEVLDYALVTDGFTENMNAVIVDIGLGGLQLRAKHQLPVGAKVKMQIGRLHQDPLQLVGEVRHTCGVDNSDLVAAGIRFCPETHEDRLSIAEYVHGVFQRQCDKLLI